MIEISVPYTDSQLSADAVEESLALGFDIEDIIDDMYAEGYNMEVFEQ